MLENAMEERKLKASLSHLSTYPRSNVGKSSALSKVDNHSSSSPNTQNKKHVADTTLSRSRSGSDILESKLLSFADEFCLRGDSGQAVSNGEVSTCKDGLASTAEHRCREWQCLRRHFPHNLGDCIRSNKEDIAASHIKGYTSDVHGLNILQDGDKTFCRRNCSSSEAGELNRSMQCNLLHSKDEVTIGVGEKHIDKITCAHQRRISTLATLISKGDCHHHTVNEPSLSVRTSERIEDTDSGNNQAFKDVHSHDIPSTDVKTNSVGSISRNNVMTGQRRFIVDDCVFCRIIQGQSPAFKLYEDDMCVCILDVHPLSHGHSLLIPKSHFPSLELTPPEVAAAMCATVPLLSMAIMQATNCDSFNLLVNSGKAAGQVVFHWL